MKRPLSTGKNRKVIGVRKDKLGGKIITEFVALRPNTYSFMIDDKKKKKMKQILKFNECKSYLLNNETILISQQKLRSEAHNVYTEEINEIALSNNDDKKLPAFYKIISYPYGVNAGKVCKAELWKYLSRKWLTLIITQMKI